MPIRCTELTSNYVLVANLLTQVACRHPRWAIPRTDRLHRCPDRVSLLSGQDISQSIFFGSLSQV